MTFGKREDDCWHWEYTGPYSKSSGKNIWLFWRAALILFYTILALVLVMNESLRTDIRAVMLTVLSTSVFLTIPFVILWLQNRYGKQGCSFTANEKKYNPGPCLYTKSTSGFRHSNTKTLTRCEERDAILINAEVLPTIIYADTEDYEAVWHFFRQRSPDAEINEPMTGAQYDERFGIKNGGSDGE